MANNHRNEKIVTAFSGWVLSAHHRAEADETDYAHYQGYANSPAKPHEVERERALIPEDRRSLTGLLCGDPIFERSALARRQGT